MFLLFVWLHKFRSPPGESPRSLRFRGTIKFYDLLAVFWLRPQEKRQQHIGHHLSRKNERWEGPRYAIICPRPSSISLDGPVSVLWPKVGGVDLPIVPIFLLVSRLSVSLPVFTFPLRFRPFKRRKMDGAAETP